jgi:hypothetical protein
MKKLNEAEGLNVGIIPIKRGAKVLEVYRKEKNSRTT